MSGKQQAYNTLWQRIRRLVSAPAEAAQSDPQGGQPVSVDADILDRDPEFLARRLRGMLSAQGSLTAGAMHIINLANVRADLLKQGRWERLESRIRTIISGIIRQHLDRVDMFIEVKGPAYIIVFAHLLPDHAAVKCAAIAREVEEKIMGVSRSLRGAKVGTAIARFTQNGLELVDGPDPDNELRHILGTTLAPVTEVGANGPGGLHPAARPSDAAVCDDVDIPASFGSRDPWIIETAGEQEGRAEGAEWYYEADVLRVPELECRYLPMWHVRQHAVGTFHCIPALPITRSQALVGEAVFEAAPKSLICDLNLRVLEIASQEIQSLRGRGGEALIGLPVHFETIASRKQRSRYLAACAALPEDIRNHLLVELIDLPEGAPDSRLCELVAWLRPWAKAICIRTSLDCQRFEGYAAAHVFAIGVVLGGEEGPEAAVMERMNGFTAKAAKYALRTYALELRTRSLTVAAMGAGFDYISGQVISSVVNAPDRAYRFNPIDLYGA
ncbi:protein of unknown function [Magnetospirillum sp. XM-1]|uniref:hypothetical protein n=1 Tax=Magnetospirillum sp. XM-1 TaxID=1663591 RepID=UPI00073DF53F|nr:hypothetical protein [Magnetospirillum sp. XM-1]CUW41090.1 protein of unknown function [Magnetospirillum sp. XM-1]